MYGKQITTILVYRFTTFVRIQHDLWCVLLKSRLSRYRRQAKVQNWRYLVDTRSEVWAEHFLSPVICSAVTRYQGSSAAPHGGGEQCSTPRCSILIVTRGLCVSLCAARWVFPYLVLSYLITYTDLLSIISYRNSSFLLFLWKV